MFVGSKQRRKPWGTGGHVPPEFGVGDANVQCPPDFDIFPVFFPYSCLCKPFMFDMHALLIIFDVIKYYVFVPPIAVITLSIYICSPLLLS